MYFRLYVNCPILFTDFNHVGIFSTGFSWMPPPPRYEMSRDMTQLICAFRDYWGARRFIHWHTRSYSIKRPTRCTINLKFIVLLRRHRSTCFGHCCAHHQEPPPTAFAATGYRMIAGGTCLKLEARPTPVCSGTCRLSLNCFHLQFSVLLSAAIDQCSLRPDVIQVSKAYL
jgi:hypothetical protein